MQYRKFGNLDFDVSALGFGAMRLPVVNDDSENIDEERAIQMIRYAIDNGVNYIDTAWPYHGGKSEQLVAKALRDGYREKVKLATKLPSWKIKNKEDMDEYLDKQLERLETDYIDFYLLHTLNKKYWETYKELSVFDWIKKIKEKGKIKHIGFSYHDDYELFKEIIDDYDKWDFCQIQYNYLDIDFQAGKKGLKYAADNGLAVVVMEPLRGGSLAEVPKPVENILNQSKKERAPVDFALQWLWNQPEVSVVLSGMSEMQHVKENVESAAKSGKNKLSNKELNLIEEARKKFEELSPIACTGCNYCMPCPNGVQIPMNFSLYNEANIFDNPDESTGEYNNMEEKMQASNCVNCGQCEPQCPQNLPIIELLENVADYFE